MGRIFEERTSRGRTTVTTTPAIILGNYVTALGAMRRLGNQGIPTYLVSEKPDFVEASRWCRQFSPSTLTEPSRLDRFLRDLRMERAVLVPCADHWTQAVTRLPSDLRERFPSSTPTADSLERLMDKGSLAQVLDQVDAPHPRTIEVRSEADIRGARDESLSQWFLKPCDSQAFRSVFHCKAFRVSDVESACTRYRSIAEKGLEVVLQEYVPGSSDRHFFIDGFMDAQGRVRTWFARQRVRIHPPDFGDSAYLRSVPLETVATAQASLERLFERIPYRGIFSVEFKQDERDGRFKLIEVNTRAWAFVEFTAACGVDVTLMAYHDALGDEIPEVTSYRVGSCMSFWPNDLLASMAQWRRGELTMGRWLRSQFEAAGSLLDLRDPAPDLLRWGSSVLGHIAKSYEHG